MSIPRISELRLSFAWTETFQTVFDRPPNGDLPQQTLAFLGNRAKFIAAFENVRQRQSDLESKPNEPEAAPIRAHAEADCTETKSESPPAGKGSATSLSMPWPRLSRNYSHHFWQYYLENVDPRGLSGEKAWQYLVPLRVQFPIGLGAPWPNAVPKCKVFLDGLVYPHGIAVVVMVRLLFKRLSGSVTDPQNGGTGTGVGVPLLMERALDIRANGHFEVTIAGERQDLKLDSLAGAVLDHLRRETLGTAEPQGNRLNEPLTVATVVRGTGGDPTMPITENSDLHKVLEGLCSWRADWKTHPLQTTPKKSTLLLAGPPDGHVVYHLARGRAVWMPGLFSTDSGRDEHRLSCYHRNLTWVTLQTEMLAQASSIYADYLERDPPPDVAPPTDLQSLARFAAIRLGCLFSTEKSKGRKQTYNSASPRAYLNENGYEETIKQVRATFKLSPLAYKPRGVSQQQ